MVLGRVEDNYFAQIRLTLEVKSDEDPKKMKTHLTKINHLTNTEILN